MKRQPSKGDEPFEKWERDEMEKLLSELRGHLVLYPTRFLEGEDVSNNFLFNADRWALIWCVLSCHTEWSYADCYPCPFTTDPVFVSFSFLMIPFALYGLLNSFEIRIILSCSLILPLNITLTIVHYMSHDLSPLSSSSDNSDCVDNSGRLAICTVYTRVVL